MSLFAALIAKSSHILAEMFIIFFKKRSISNLNLSEKSGAIVIK